MSTQTDHDRDHVIKITISGNTVYEIDQAAKSMGLTAEQWIFRTLATKLIPCQDQEAQVDYIA